MRRGWLFSELAALLRGRIGITNRCRFTFPSPLIPMSLLLWADQV